jgi:MFS family permease
MSAFPDAGTRVPSKRLSTPALIMTSIYNLGVNAVWLSYNLFLLPILMQNAPSEKTIRMLFTVGAGLLSDKLGRRNIIIFSAIIAALVGLFFPFARTFVIFLLFSAFYAASNGVILSVDTAFTSDLVPPDEAGKYMAYANLATGVANGVAAPIFGLILNSRARRR